jgi:hypothetical protein
MLARAYVLVRVCAILPIAQAEARTLGLKFDTKTPDARTRCASA